MGAAKDFLTLVGHRYSCREFYDKQLTDEELNVILEAVRKSPSARNLQPTRICVVQSPEGLAKIDECTRCRYGAPTVLIAAYDHDVSSHPTPDHGPETCDFGDIDTTIALTNIDDAVASLGSAAAGWGRSIRAKCASCSTCPRATAWSSCSWWGIPRPLPARCTRSAASSTRSSAERRSDRERCRNRRKSALTS